MFRQTAKKNALNSVLITGYSNCFFDHQKSSKRDSELLQGGQFSPIKLWFLHFRVSTEVIICMFYCVGFCRVSGYLFAQLFPLIYRAINIQIEQANFYVSEFYVIVDCKSIILVLKYLNQMFFVLSVLHNADRYHSPRPRFRHNKMLTTRRTGSCIINADLRFGLFPVQITRASKVYQLPGVFVLPSIKFRQKSI